MKRFAMTCMLKDRPGVIEEYEEYHANIFPEVVEGSRQAGIKRTFIYRLGLQLFMFFETGDDFDPDRDLQKYAQTPRARQWDQLMRELQTHLPGQEPGSTWIPMKEIFALEH